MKKRLLKTAVATALTLAFAAPAFAAANPFSDVPAKHWAYDAVNKLAQAGIVDGYGDGTFRGDKTMTRYEMATIVAKAMSKNLNNDQKAVVDKLSKEFGTELNTLGVKVAGLQNQVDNMVKFSGDARVRYLNDEKVDGTTSVNKFDYRVRLGATAKINDSMSLYARYNTGNMDPAATPAAPTGTAQIENVYVNFKALGFSGKIGRQDYDLGQGMLAGAASTAIINGVSIKEGNFFAVAGNEQNAKDQYVTTVGGQYSFNMFGAPLTTSYLKLDNVEYAAASTSFNLMPGVKVSGEYGKNLDNKADAYAVKASFGTTGLSVGYKNVKQNAIPFESNMNLKAGLNDFYALQKSGDVKGYEVNYNKDIAKNTNLDILYQDIKDHDKNVRVTASVKF